jgi:hypothetical protein
MNSTASSVSELQGVSRVPEILAGNLIPELFATLFFAARVWSRAWLLKTWGWDDTWLSISWVRELILYLDEDGAYGVVVVKSIANSRGSSSDLSFFASPPASPPNTARVIIHLIFHQKCSARLYSWALAHLSCINSQ